MLATTAREHVDFLIAAMNPARAQDLPAVVEVGLQGARATISTICFSWTTVVG